MNDYEQQVIFTLLWYSILQNIAISERLDSIENLLNNIIIEEEPE